MKRRTFKELADEETRLTMVRQREDGDFRLDGSSSAKPFLENRQMDNELLTFADMAKRFDVSADWLQRYGANDGFFPVFGDRAFTDDVAKFIRDVHASSRRGIADLEAEKRRQHGSLNYHQQREQKLRDAALTLSRIELGEPVYDGGENDPQVVLMRKMAGKK